MVKIFLSVRNRLSITVKCIEALKKHSELPHQIYVYNNATNHLLDEHFMYFHEAYKKRQISQVTFTTPSSTFNAFSKASTCNFFGQQHEQDPNKDNYTFLLMLDNDIIVTPGWDMKLKRAWKYVNKKGLKHIKVIGQLPGGIKGTVKPRHQIDEMEGKIGKLGGSGLWSVRSNFFRDVGFLDLRQLVNHDKRHDQLYWRQMEVKTNGKPYIMGLNQKLGIHCGKVAGSVCNVLTRNRGKKRKEELIKFDHAEKRISKMDFDTFFKKIFNDISLVRDW
ncbi:MAG: glycosyltransferase family 2 protein [Candidatus Thorarchaeota archaeon]